MSCGKVGNYDCDLYFLKSDTEINHIDAREVASFDSVMIMGIGLQFWGSIFDQKSCNIATDAVD